MAGATQATVGAVGVGASGTLCTTGLGCVLGAVTGTVSADYMVAGVKQTATGNATLPYGEQVLQSLGLSPQAAAYTYAVLGMTPAVIEGVMVNNAANQAAKLNLATREGNATLAAQEASIPVTNPFITKGVVFTNDLLTTNPAVKGIYNDYLVAFAGNVARAEEFTARAVQSGQSLPVARIVGRNEELVRLVPVGNDAGMSSFYMSRVQYDMLIGTGKNAQQVAEALGLPAQSYSAGGFRGFQAVSIQAQPGKIATAYETTIAPIEQGAFTATGQLKQLIVPNLKDFTPPTPIPGGIIPVARSR